MTTQHEFPFSDLIMGYVTEFDPAADSLTVTTTDGRPYEIGMHPLTSAEIVRNLGEPYRDATDSLRDRFTPGRLVFVYGTYLPGTETTRFEAKKILFLGDRPDEYRFEERTWWVDQLRQMADYYLRAEFGDGPVDWHEYRTTLTADGRKTDEDSHRQECDTISRLVYGMASAYLLTGDDRFREAAETGTEYLRTHFRGTDPETGTSFWYHAIDWVQTGTGETTSVHERKVFASEFGDDYDAVPLYEQIYALAGPVQTFRISGDPRVLADVTSTADLFDRYFLDNELGGYFSHADPIDFDPRAPQLGQDRARKNWNSVGDHAPAYLINVVAATAGEKRWTEMLTMTADTVIAHFGDYENSPFVNERFFEDWSMDQSWGWQQNRAVVGHNLKIAWNLMRVQNLAPRDEYVSFARRIAEVMPAAGSDQQRGGWYDVVERTRRDGDLFFPFAWHDRKAWWQQEQAILAYLVLAGCLGDEEYRRRAREAAAFYNAWFLDHDSGGVYFNVLANGIPYLLGTERLKGSHSMAGYHSFELCYLAATYTNLLLTRQPLDLYFKPMADQLPDRVLHISPDLLPPGAVRIRRVWVDGVPSEDFDDETLAVRIPEGPDRPTVRVELVPAECGDSHDLRLDTDGTTTTVTLVGDVGEHALAELRAALAELPAADPRQVVFDLDEADSLSPAVCRAIAFACSKLDLGCEVVMRGACASIRADLDAVDLSEAVRFD
ncbi:MAG: N-acyl-D-glucosamine 2-epimerase [Actinomycetales bacterium]|nr:N-acyl-D-glucosamine 2-epimerase [Actinomycetales bacterium]